MTISIDGTGRLVIPKSIRDAAGIRAGTPLEVRFRDGRIEIEPAAVEVSITDAHITACARKSGGTRLATFNRRHFERLDLGAMTLVVPSE